ncbi:hypothetical protein BDZ45DRAFT_743311 [Acephala macrosclerotiorum]|nr:hypothetical protein BDZ45DRAFT_743311 [Acephala macrosclerotiorum]
MVGRFQDSRPLTHEARVDESLLLRGVIEIVGVETEWSNDSCEDGKEKRSRKMLPVIVMLANTTADYMTLKLLGLVLRQPQAPDMLMITKVEVGVGVSVNVQASNRSPSRQRVLREHLHNFMLCSLVFGKSESVSEPLSVLRVSIFPVVDNVQKIMNEA